MIEYRGLVSLFFSCQLGNDPLFSLYPATMAGLHVMHLSIPAFNSKHHVLTEVHAKMTPYVSEKPSLLACMRAHPVPWHWNSFTLAPFPHCGLPSSLATFHNSLKTSSNPVKSASDRAAGNLYCTALLMHVWALSANKRWIAIAIRPPLPSIDAHLQLGLTPSQLSPVE